MKIHYIFLDLQQSLKYSDISKKFSNSQTDWFTMVPTIYNADTLGIRPDIIGRPIESWTELLNPEFKGKASILNIASIGIMDAAMVCEAMGEVKYGDKGNMTKDEIDKTMAIFTEAKKNGQFRAFWKTFDESVNLNNLAPVLNAKEDVLGIKNEPVISPLADVIKSPPALLDVWSAP